MCCPFFWTPSIVCYGHNPIGLTKESDRDVCSDRYGVGYKSTRKSLAKDITFQKWDHMAFSGWTRDNFLNADSLYPALDAFEHWLQPEDILCWWHQEAYDLYIMFTKVAQIRDRASMVVFLSDYIYGFLAGQKGAVGSPYKICAARDIPTPEPAHCSINDVLAIQALVQAKKSAGATQEVGKGHHCSERITGVSASLRYLNPAAAPL